MSQFKEKYKYYPGDFPKAIEQLGATANGNGDIIIQSGLANPREARNAFEHLWLAKLLSFGKAPWTTPFSGSTSVLVVGHGVPETIFPGVGIVVAGSDNSGLQTTLILDIGGNLADRLWGAGLNALIAMAVDQKLDDGKPMTGNFRSGDASGTTSINPNINCITAPNNYVVTPESGCRSYIKYTPFVL